MVDSIVAVTRFSPAFLAAIQVVLVAEGVLSDQVGDSGGETVFGIARNYHPTISWPPTKAEAINIYLNEYWLAHLCDQMPWPWALAVFDCAVNQPRMMAEWVQESLGVHVDGKLGMQTLSAIRAAPQENLLTFLALRALGYVGQPLWLSDGKGWLKRLFRIAQAASIPLA
jgi:lysozyme family protein